MAGLVVRALQGMVNATWRATHRRADLDSYHLRGAPATAYEAASSRRRMRDWRPPPWSPTSILSVEGEMLRLRSKSMVRNNPWASAASEQFDSDVVGRGIRPWWADLPKAKRVELKRLWSAWVSEAQSCETCDFYGLQGVVMRCLFDSGDCFIRLRSRRMSDGLTVPLQLELIPPEMVPFEENRVLGNGNTIRQGIEFDRLGRIVRYWMHPQHPGDFLARRPGDGRRLIPVPASEVLHVHRVLEVGQVRGTPGMSSVLRRLRALDHYDDAELERKGLASSVVGFIRNDGAYNPTDEASKAEGPGGQNQDDVVEEPWGIGQLHPLEPGQDVQFPQLPSVGDYDRYMPTQLRAVAAGGGVFYPHVTGDLTGVTYSSARVGLINHVRKVRLSQMRQIQHQLCRPVLKRWLRQAALAGRTSLPGYADDPSPYEQPWWVPDGFEWVDPERQVKAATQECRSGFTARALVLMSRGIDPDEVDDLNEADAENVDGRGLSYDSDGRRPMTGTAATAPDEENAQPENGEQQERTPGSDEEQAA